MEGGNVGGGREGRWKERRVVEGEKVGEREKVSGGREGWWKERRYVKERKSVEGEKVC